MLGGLFLAAKANNLGIVNAYNSQGWLEGDVRARANLSSSSVSLDINASKGFFKYKSVGAVDFFPAFQIVRFVGVGGGGGGSGWVPGGVAGGGGGGRHFNLLGMLSRGGLLLSGGPGGYDYESGDTNGRDGYGNIDQSLLLATLYDSFGGRGGRMVGDGAPVQVWQGQKTTLTPYGDGGDGNASGTMGGGGSGYIGKLDVQGLVW